MAKRDDGLVWTEFDVDTLPAQLAKSLEGYREAEAKAAELKKSFTAAFISEAEKSGLGAPKGTEIILSFRFGNVSMAYKEKVAKKDAKQMVGFGKATGGLKPRRS
jgi:hypothetical protein